MMNSQEKREFVCNTLEEMAQYKILIKEQNEFYAEPSYTISPEFRSKMIKHFEIQDAIEKVDQSVAYSSLDYGGLTRTHYIIGITVNDFLKTTPRNCEKCKSFLRTNDDTMEDFLKKRHTSAREELMKHMEMEHHDLYLIQEKLNKILLNWILLIESFSNNKEWRSKL